MEVPLDHKKDIKS